MIAAWLGDAVKVAHAAALWMFVGIIGAFSRASVGSDAYPTVDIGVNWVHHVRIFWGLVPFIKFGMNPRSLKTDVDRLNDPFTVCGMPDAHRKIKKQIDALAKIPSEFKVEWFQKLAED
jgi:hypothetical protein